MRGKHGVAAANRLAQLDTELVADLRSRVEVLTRERDDAHAALDLAQRTTASEIGREAAALADARVRELRIELAEEQRKRVAERATTMREVMALLDEYHVRMDMEGYTRLATTFRTTVGEIVNVTKPVGNRTSRRASVRHVRAIEDIKRQRGGK